MLLVYHIIFSAFMTLIQGMLFYKIHFSKVEKTTLKIIPSNRITPSTTQLSIQRETVRKLDENKFYQGRTNHTTPTKEDMPLSSNRHTNTSVRRPQKNKTVPIQVIYDSEQQQNQETKETKRNNKKYPQTYIGKPIKLSLFSKMPKPIKQTSIVPVDPEEQTKIEFVGELREIGSSQENINILIESFNFSSRILILQGIFTWFLQIDVYFLILAGASFIVLQILRICHSKYTVGQLIQGFAASAFCLTSLILNSYNSDYSYALIGSFVLDMQITIIFMCYKDYQNQKT